MKRPDNVQSAINSIESSTGSPTVCVYFFSPLSSSRVLSRPHPRQKMQGACIVLSGREDRAFVTHRGSMAELCREDIDVPRLIASDHVHVGA